MLEDQTMVSIAKKKKKRKRNWNWKGEEEGLESARTIVELGRAWI